MSNNRAEKLRRALIEIEREKDLERIKQIAKNALDGDA